MENDRTNLGYSKLFEGPNQNWIPSTHTASGLSFSFGKFKDTSSVINKIIDVIYEDANTKVCFKLPFIIPTKMRFYRIHTVKNFEIKFINIYQILDHIHFSGLVGNMFRVEVIKDKWNSDVRIKSSGLIDEEFIPIMEKIYNSAYVEPAVNDFALEEIRTEIVYRGDPYIDGMECYFKIKASMEFSDTCGNFMVTTSEMLCTRKSNDWSIQFTLEEYFTDENYNVDSRCQKESVCVKFMDSQRLYSELSNIENFLFEQAKAVHVDLPADENIIHDFKEHDIYDEGDENRDFDDGLVLDNDPPGEGIKSVYNFLVDNNDKEGENDEKTNK